MRRKQIRQRPGGVQADAIGRAISSIEAASARIRPHDLGALDKVLAAQMLALDTLFTELARESAQGSVFRKEPMRLALRAQSQSRASLTSFVALIGWPSAFPEPATQKSSEQTIGKRKLR